jgi:hypothetical protein
MPSEALEIDRLVRLQRPQRDLATSNITVCVATRCVPEEDNVQRRYCIKSDRAVSPHG